LKDKIKNIKVIQRDKGKTIRTKYYRFGLNDKIENKKIIRRVKKKNKSQIEKIIYRLKDEIKNK
jgi:hypothetical protein